MHKRKTLMPYSGLKQEKSAKKHCFQHFQEIIERNHPFSRYLLHYFSIFSPFQQPTCILIIASIIMSSFRNLYTIQKCVEIHYPYKSNLFHHRLWLVIGYIHHVPGHLGVGPLQRQMLPSFYIQVQPSSHNTTWE